MRRTNWRSKDESHFIRSNEPAPAPEPVPEAAPAPGPVFEPVPEPAPEPPPVAAPSPGPVFEPVPEPVPEAAPVPEPEIQAVTPTQLEPPSSDDQFSTETLADLYAQQGLIDKAVGIYRQILEQAPDNEAVKFKLDTLQAQTPTLEEPLQGDQLREAEPTEPLQKDGNEDMLSILEGFLNNAERMKRS